MNLALNKIFFFLFIIAGNLNSFAQNNTNKKFSYIIWISEYQKKWIDSENSYWLIETDKPLLEFKSDFFEKTFLFTGDDYEIQQCCDDVFFKSNKYEIAKETFYSESAFFNQKETLKIKYKDFTIKILAIEQSNCKCSSKYVNKYGGNERPITMSIITNYKTLKLTIEEKSSFRKNKKEIVKLLE